MCVLLRAARQCRRQCYDIVERLGDLQQWQHCWQQLRFIEQSIAARQFCRLARGGPARQFGRLAHAEACKKARRRADDLERPDDLD